MYKIFNKTLRERNNNDIFKRGYKEIKPIVPIVLVREINSVKPIIIYYNYKNES